MSQIQQRQPEPDEGDIDPNTLETLPRTQFMDVITKRITKSLEKSVLASLKDEIGQLRTNVTTSNVQKQLDSALTKFPDLLEYKDEMMDLAKRHPTLSPTDLYHLAKNEAPAEKIAEVAKKFPAAGEGAAAPKKINFGGFLPSNGSGSEGNSKMAPTEAAASAWDSVVAELGGEPIFSE